MKKQTKKAEKHNLGLTVLAGSLFFISGSITLSMLPISWSNFGLFIIAIPFTLMTLIIAIYGRLGVFKEFVKGILRSFGIS